MKTIIIITLAAFVPQLAQAQPRTRAALVTELRTRLTALEATPATETASDPGDLDLAPLVGASRAEIERGLGAPQRCNGPDAAHDEQGRWVPTAPCRTPDDGYYRYFRFPPGTRVGGGPYLWLAFDRAGVCTQAAWRRTR